jgi:DNA-directed RNA polymerase I subunit RPA1
MILTI